MPTTAEAIVRTLASFPNRAVASISEKPAQEYLKSLFENNTVIEQPFRTHKNYLITVWWLILGTVAGLVLTYFFSWPGTLVTLFFAYAALAYFNWYPSPVSAFPPLVETKNLYVKEASTKKKRVLLMAHYDTAPISFLYTPNMVGSFRQSLVINQFIILASFLASLLFSIFHHALLGYLLWVLSAYFILQLVIASIDFFRFGYSNGASDNATGVAAAVMTFNRMKEQNLEHVAVDVLLTGAEEVGMIGAKAFYEKYKKELEGTFVINFDTLGNGSLRIITETGSFTSIKYENILSQIGQEIIATDPDFSHVTTGAWHTADFDSVWFNRGRVPTLTLAALDANGRMPNIHRETDVLANVDFKPMHDAIALAGAMILKLDTP